MLRPGTTSPAYVCERMMSSISFQDPRCSVANTLTLCANPSLQPHPLFNHKTTSHTLSLHRLRHHRYQPAHSTDLEARFMVSRLASWSRGSPHGLEAPLKLLTSDIILHIKWFVFSLKTQLPSPTSLFSLSNCSC